MLEVEQENGVLDVKKTFDYFNEEAQEALVN